MTTSLTDTSVHNGFIVPARSLDFSNLAPIEVPVKLPWKRDEQGHVTVADFILVEASHATAKQYRAQSLKSAELIFNDGDDTRTIRNLSSTSAMDTWLIAQCLFRIEGDKRVKVDESWVNTLQDRITSAIMEELQEITPSLRAKEDLPTLKKQLEKLQAKIKRLEDAEPKKSQPVGTESSDWHTN